MNHLVLDTETTISNKGNPFDTTNKLCYVGLGLCSNFFSPNGQKLEKSRQGLFLKEKRKLVLGTFDRVLTL